MSSQKTLAGEIPASLKPGDPNVYFSTNEAGAKSIAICYRENHACHEQIKNTPSNDHSLDILIGVGALALGFFLGKTL